MKETIRSLSIYFVIAGLFGLIGNVAGLAQSRGNPLVVILLLPGVAVGGSYFYFGLRLRSLLVGSPRLVLGVLTASAVYLGLMFVLGLVTDPTSCIQLGIGLLITGYLIVNVKRLSSEALNQPSEAQP